MKKFDIFTKAFAVVLVCAGMSACGGCNKQQVVEEEVIVAETPALVAAVNEAVVCDGANMILTVSGGVPFQAEVAAEVAEEVVAEATEEVAKEIAPEVAEVPAIVAPFQVRAEQVEGGVGTILPTTFIQQEDGSYTMDIAVGVEGEAAKMNLIVTDAAGTEATVAIEINKCK